MLLNTKSFLLTLSALTLGACATTQKGKLFEYGLIGAALGAAYGHSKPEYQTQNSMLYGSQGAVLGMAIATITDDSDKKLKDLEAKVKFFDETSRTNTQSTLTDLPEEFRPLLESQNYEVYRINRWTRKGPKYLVKESEVIEFK
jgi:hypothetical protein